MQRAKDVAVLAAGAIAAGLVVAAAAQEGATAAGPERLSDDRLARFGVVVRRPGAQAEEPPYAPSSAPPVITGPRLSGPPPAGLISIQLAAVSFPTWVDPALARLGEAARGVRADLEVSVRPPPEGGRWWRLLPGPFEDEAAARAACRALAAVSPDCWLPRDL